MIERKRVFVFGEPSIDHIVKLTDDGARFLAVEEGVWNLPPEAYFTFRGRKNEEDVIFRIAAGKKWPGKTLQYAEKSTLTKDDRGYVQVFPFESRKWNGIRQDPNAIIAKGQRTQLGGPARNSLEVLVKSPSEEIRDPINTNFFFLGGYDSATNLYEVGVNRMGSENHTVAATVLRSSEWATHEAFSFEIPRLGARTLIRNQEHRRHFPEEDIATWFSEQNGSLTDNDLVIVNSLKHPDLIRYVAEFVELYKTGMTPLNQKKVIVAPTTDMYKNEPGATKKLLAQADVVICNLQEAADIVGERLSFACSPADKYHIIKKFSQNSPQAQIYISDGKHQPWLIERQSVVYTMQPYDIACHSPINAGDTWTGLILKGILEGSSGQQTLQRATAYASLRVATDPRIPISSKELKELMDQQPRSVQTFYFT